MMEPFYEHKYDIKTWEEKFEYGKLGIRENIEVYAATFRQDSGAKRHYLEIVVIDGQFDSPAQYRVGFVIDEKGKEHNEWLAGVLSYQLARIVQDSSKNTKNKIKHDAQALADFIGFPIEGRR